MPELEDREQLRRERKKLRIAAQNAHPFDLARPLDPGVLVVDDQAPSPNALVVLPGREGRLGASPPVAVFAALEGLPMRRVYVRDLVGVPDHPWGSDLKAVTAALQQTLAGVHRRVYLGTSLGGLLALLLGTLTGADHVIAVNPTTYLGDGAEGLPQEDRWPQAMGLLTAETVGASDLRTLWREHQPPTADVHFSYRNAVHRAHAEHIAELPGVELHAHYEFLPLPKIRDNGTLRRQVEGQLIQAPM